MDLDKAVVFLKENGKRKFDETVELHVHLGVDPQRSDQMVRSTVTYTAGNPKPKKVVVFTDDATKQTAAKEAGAALVGGSDLIATITKTGVLEADMTVATPDMMPKLAKVARILGPQGLMPNPKTGTVTPHPAQAVKDLMAGKAPFKMDALGNIHEAVGKLSWPADKIADNTRALLEAIRAAKPSSVKGQFIKTVTLKSTMSPGIKLSV